MADTVEFDWNGITAKAVERLQTEKVTPVHESIVKHAQNSYDGVDGKHVLEFDFGDNIAKAEAFAKLLKKAGAHTTPMTSLTVKVNPDKHKGGEYDKPGLVRWRAGTRRGRQAGAEVKAEAEVDSKAEAK